MGAKRLDRVSAGVRASLRIVLVYSVLTFLIIYPLADTLMWLFVDSGGEEIVEHAAQFMRINNYFYAVLGVLCILRYSIQGLGFSNLSMLSGVMEMVARCGVSLWLVPAFHFTGVCFGDPVAWIAADLFLIPAYFFVLRLLRKRLAG